ncbi:thiol reductant ABC exporter subunit CydD [Metabacillus sp. 84]|uniref:thiol reductant ABC exporter subunit CydD n=1 Tax=unclassified Metabacillus TaxID=2675274 RepID=UPI003CF9D4C8
MEQLRKRALAHKKWMIPLFLSSVMNGVLLVGQAYGFVYIVDQVFLKEAALQDVFPAFILLLLTLTARVWFIFLSRKLGIRIGTKVKGEIRRELIRKYAGNPLQSSLSGQTGKKAGVVMDAVDEIDPYFSFYIPQLIQTSILPLIILIAVFTEHLYSGLLMLVTAPFFPIYMIVIGLKTQKKADRQMEKMTAFSGHFLDVLQGLPTLKLLGKSKEQKQLIRQKSFEFRDATMDVLKTAFSSSLALEFIAMLSVGLIAFELGLQLVVFENMTFFGAFFILILAPDFYLALRDLGSAFHAGRGSMGAAGKIAEELEDTGKDVEWGSSEWTFEAPPEISFDHVHFSYTDGSFSLRDVTIAIKPFQKAAIIGPNGSGKTTMLRLLSGLVDPSDGTIFVNGRPRGEFSEQGWFRKMTYISQHPYLFSGTIKENICLGATDEVDEQELIAAVEKSGLIKLIESLDQGIDTRIGEGGRGLSGGEKQRIALARAFVKKPSLILFDEPTTGLDLYTERILQSSIRELSERASMITVAHRLYTIREADLLIYMSGGKVLASGTHEQLLKAVPAYQNMVQEQRGAVKL